MNGTILIVEDSKIDLKVLKHALADANCEMKLVHYDTADAALDYLLDVVESKNASDKLPSFITLDLNLPGMHGLDFLRAVKMNPNLVTIPVIILSTSNNPIDVQSTYSSGAAAYMRKKLSYEEFSVDINAMVDFWTRRVLLNS